MIVPHQAGRTGSTLLALQNLGQTVSQGDPVAAIRSGAETLMVPAPDSGVVTTWWRRPGEAVGPGAEIAEIEQIPSAMGGRIMTQPPTMTMVRPLLQNTTHVPQVTSTVEADMSRVVALRNAVKEQFQRATGAPLGYMPFFIKAAVHGLQASPGCNGMLAPQGLWLHDRIRLGVSVDTPTGAQVPVIHDPDRKSLAQLAVELQEKSTRARANRLSMEDVTGATFGLSNSGTLGCVRDVPMVIPPHVATMTAGAIVDRPVAVNGRVEIRPIASLTLSFDHRAIDGETAMRLLNQAKSCLESARFA